jgi:hypothetical protein
MGTFESLSGSELEAELEEQKLLIGGMLDVPDLELYAPTISPRASRSVKNRTFRRNLSQAAGED